MIVSVDEIRNLRLTRKWLKYYRIDEVDSFLLRVANQIEEENGEISALRTKNEALYRETSEWTEKATRQEQTITEQIREIGEVGDQLTQCRIENVQQSELIAEQSREIGELGDQLTKYRIENVQQSEQIAQQAAELKRLQTRIEKLDEQIVMLERQNSDDIIEEAVRKAEKIVNKAVEDRDKMLLQIDEQRGRLVAACRAAYYNALQFKQELAEHFKNMEQELDASIDVLQVLDNSRLALNHNTVETVTELNYTQ